MQQPPPDVVSGDQYRYALSNFRIAHEKVEQQRIQLEEQERQVAAMRLRIQLLEGGVDPRTKHGGSSIDDFSIKNSASRLDKLINRWAADIVRNPPCPISDLYRAVASDLNGLEDEGIEATPMAVQYLLRHAMSETISEGIINCLMVTNSTEANIQLTRLHEHLFTRDPTVACVWRRQTFSAAIETCTPEMSLGILLEHMPSLTGILSPSGEATPLAGASILEIAYEFSRMLHGAGANSGATDAFYRAFVPELGSTLYPRQIELIKRCVRNEQGDSDTVGATIFPGLVKVTRGPMTPAGPSPDNIQTVVRRAQVICQCALGAAPLQSPQ